MQQKAMLTLLFFLCFSSIYSQDTTNYIGLNMQLKLPTINGFKKLESERSKGFHTEGNYNIATYIIGEESNGNSLFLYGVKKLSNLNITISRFKELQKQLEAKYLNELNFTSRNDNELLEISLDAILNYYKNDTTKTNIINHLKSSIKGNDFFKLFTYSNPSILLESESGFVINYTCTFKYNTLSVRFSSIASSCLVKNHYIGFTATIGSDNLDLFNDQLASIKEFYIQLLKSNPNK